MAAAVPDFPYDAAVAELRTIRDLLRFGVTQLQSHQVFFGHGFPDARTEAGYLIAWALHLPPGTLDDHLGASLLRGERKMILDLFRRRVLERVPSPYLTGEAWLGEFSFRVDDRVLIPRSFIADLLGEGLAPWVADPEQVTDALDMCTGSGCLAILLAHAFPAARVEGVDISSGALDVARHNLADYGLQERIALHASDLFASVPPRTYDVIVSNPPYVDQSSMDALPPEYRKEPSLALAGGSDGLDLVRRLIEEASGRLKPGGVLVVEIGHNREALEAAFPDLPFTWLETHAGHEFVFLLTREQLP